MVRKGWSAFPSFQEQDLEGDPQAHSGRVEVEVGALEVVSSVTVRCAHIGQ